ncbi:hypothetical protein C8J55DRAFT_423240 [Lentinula edodes]|uniref:HNH nuclease domain-containing protein n=1 Tax=Lentinula lateritia TaxID=40482 RepID=A0A9W9DWM1_9AGAR|nr:hypothetical protein C8J55DRAFT_423240 [Lentinula edodes]
MYTTTTLYYIPFTLAAVYHPRLDEHSLQRRLLGPAVPLWDPVDSTEPRIYLSIYLRFFLTPDHKGVYDLIYAAERLTLLTAKDNKAKLVSLRVLGYLVLLAPGPDHKALAEIATAVRTTDSSDLYVLGEIYSDCFVRSFYKFKGSRTPFTPSHPSRPSFDARVQEIKATILQAPKNHSEAKDKALVRDGYRCVVTGIIDTKCKGFFDLTELKNSGTLRTECAHIMPEATYFDLDKGKTKDYSASVLAVFDRFGVQFDKLNEGNIHSLWNVMTLVQPIHDSFDRLELWFEATSNEHEYFIKTTDETNRLLSELNGPITLTSSDPDVPLPDPKLLAFHAAACRVAHLSGATEYMEEILRDFERLNVLAEDGGSLAILEHAFFQAGLVRVEV